MRLQLKESCRRSQIPVKLQQAIDLPAVTSGPVRIDGATMPIQVGGLGGDRHARRAVDLGPLRPRRPRQDQGRARGGRYERRRRRDGHRREGRRPRQEGRKTDAKPKAARRSEAGRDAPRCRRRRAVAVALSLGPGCRKDREKPEQIKAEIAALEKERDALRERVGELIGARPARQGHAGDAGPGRGADDAHARADREGDRRASSTR